MTYVELCDAVTHLNSGYSITIGSLNLPDTKITSKGFDQFGFQQECSPERDVSLEELLSMLTRYMREIFVYISIYDIYGQKPILTYTCQAGREFTPTVEMKLEMKLLANERR